MPFSTISSSCVIVRPQAEAELHEAYDWYETQRPGLGEEFLLCVDACMAAIHHNPRLYPPIHGDVRRALMRRFPYGVFYVLGDEAITVLAVFHLSRDPRRWQQRAP